MRRLAFSVALGLGLPTDGRRRAGQGWVRMDSLQNRRTTRARKGVTLAALALLATTLAGCIGYDGDFDRGYQIDESTVAQVKVGATTKPETLTLLGTPSTTSTVGGDAWYYIGQKMHRSVAFMPVEMTDQYVLAVYFEKGGKVSRIANYGLKDGKVFDFVTRTTPTGGAEPDFLRNIMTGLFRFQ
jgi:outer membrane protein assembly factor BamE (lipoprotein component of BamABCDE complex)